MPKLDEHERLSDLTQGEHMLLWGFRAAAFGVADCRLVRRQFEEACGPLGLEALTALTVFVRELGLGGRRKISLAAPGSYRLTRDEQTVLALFASAQAEDYARLEAHLAWLLADAPRAPFPAAACMVAQALAMNGLVLRLPMAQAAPMRSDEGDDGVVTPFRRRAAR
jgi:hypothetical protein